MKIKHNTLPVLGTGSGGNGGNTHFSTTSIFNSNPAFNFNMNGPSSVAVNFSTNPTANTATNTNANANNQTEGSMTSSFVDSRSMLARINEDSLSPSFSTQIQTRSKAAQQHSQRHHQTLNTSNSVSGSAIKASCTTSTTTDPSSSFKRHSHSHHNHNQSQHAIGKIVKPIPVRPVSSSSSSSTHSSSFCSATANLILKTHHNNISNNTSTNVDNVSLSNVENNESSSSLSNNGNFSLIAKYFASFPATRLKAQSPIPQNDETMAMSSSLATFKPQATPFLPFKKTQSSHHNNNTNNNYNINNNAHLSLLGSTQNSANMSASLTGNSGVQSSTQVDNDGIQFNLRSSSHNHHHHLNNTDHLCTNFKRMIKLNDNHNHVIASNIEEATSSPRTAASNTPTGLLDSDSSSNHSNGGDPLLANCFALNANGQGFLNNLNNDSNSSTTATTAPIFGQITMETRSTRKFLIKHHPYLQLNNTNISHQHNELNRSNTTNNSSNKQQLRPSINLIKMKRMIYANNSNQRGAEASPVLNKSNRASRNNGESWDGHDQNLVKFTDMAPSPVYSSTSQRIKNQLLLASTKRRQSTATILPSTSNSTCNSDTVLTRAVNNILTSEASPTFSTTSHSVNNSNTNANLNKTPQSYSLKTRKSSMSGNSASFAAPTTPITPYQLKHVPNNSNNMTSAMANSNTQLLGKTENEWSYFLNTSGGDNVNSFSHENICWNSGDALDDDDIDDSQEDSSGYYSSYHSVDLISSSGGSSGGDLSKHQQSSKTLGLNVFSVKQHDTMNKDLITQTLASTSGDMSGQVKSNNQIPPHHHYHTRYLTNILQQNHSQAPINNSDLTSHRNRSTTPTVKQNQNVSNISNCNNNTPTTRLRYQQQLAAAAASANLIKSTNILTAKQQHQLEIDSACDLDLDQIEND